MIAASIGISNRGRENQPLGTFTRLVLQLLFISASESMGNHDSKIVDAGSVN
jgi:hypothetical protein